MLIYDIAKIKSMSNKKSKILSKILKHVYFHRYIPELYFKEDYILTDLDLTEICETIYRYDKEINIDRNTTVSAKLYPNVNLYELFIVEMNESSEIKYRISIDMSKHNTSNDIYIVYESEACSITFTTNKNLDDSEVKASANKSILRFINTVLKRAINLFIDEIYFNIL